MFAEQFVEKEKREAAETISREWDRSRVGEEQFTESKIAERFPFFLIQKELTGF